MPKTVKQVTKPTPTKSTTPAKTVAAKTTAPATKTVAAPVKTETKTTTTATPTPAATPESSVATELTAVITQLNDLRSLVSTLQTRVRNLQREHTKEVRALTKAATKKTKRTTDANRKPSGFAKPSKLSDKLCSFLGVSSGSEMPRTEVTRRISAYVKSAQLQKAEDKKFFTPDNKLKSILSPLEGDHKATGYSFFNLQKYIKHNFTAIQASA